MGIAVRFWGVRGSIASPGPRTAEFGGNTSCVEVRCGDRVLIIDAGTGIRALGDTLAAEGVPKAELLLSHLHWDHIQGIPFFAPAWMPGREVEIWGARSLTTPELSLGESISRQMMPPHFPVRLADMKASLSFREVEVGGAIETGDVVVRAGRLHHPGGAVGWRIEHAGRSVVYASDTEHMTELDSRLVELARGADLLIYDAMYSEDEYRGRKGPPKVGWGHSTWEAGIAVAEAAKVDQLVLFHHDPGRDDDAVRAIERQAAAHRAGTIAAREGLKLTLDRRASAAKAA